MIRTINMLNKSDSVKGKDGGVASASEEAIDLIKKGIGKEYKILENEKTYANITHLHSINLKSLNYILKIDSLKKHGKVIGSVHYLPETLENSFNMPKFIRKIFYFYIIKIYKKMDYLVTVNPYFVHKLKEYGIDENKISYVPNFVDEEKFFPIDVDEKQKLKDKYKIKKDSFVVLGVGHLQKRKGIFDFLKVAENLKEFEFVWAGSFPFGAMSEGYSEIKKYLKNPPKNVHFLGNIERKNMNEIYNLADVLLFPSLSEVFPMVLLEAMSCNVPILVRDISLYKEILFDFYLKEKNVEGFTKILKNLKEDENFYKKAKEMSKKGHEFYSSEHVLKMWQDFYKKVENS